MRSPLFVTIVLQCVYQPLHPVCGFLLHLRGNVSVDIQGKGDRCMPQILGYGLDRITDPDRVCRVSMAEVMEARIWDCCSSFFFTFLQHFAS